MDYFRFRQGQLHCEQVPVEQLVARFGTPLYVYSQTTLAEHYDRIATAFRDLHPTICFSIKSCQNVHICRVLAGRGAGFDVVSGGELARALQAGADPARIVFAGVGKTDVEINQAIDAGIGWFNVESEAELANLAEIAAGRSAQVRAALRVNPDVDPDTHAYTTTGKKETKFGIDLDRAGDVFARFGRNTSVLLRGLHLHIGSPVNTVAPYKQSVEKALALIDQLRRDGFDIEAINIGGGFGAYYLGEEAPSATEYASAIVPLLEGRQLRVLMEPGRSIAANAGILVTRVLYLKRSGSRQFVIVDAGMNDLIRPALYGAFHFIWPVSPSDDFAVESRQADLRMPGTLEVDVVGPVCETGDFLGKGRHLPPIQRGDLLAIFSAGAYGMVMSSQYNSRPRAAEVLVHDDDVRLIRRRETYDDLLAPERV
ncbi:MAG TPA: diaminopimelate decarboxylase [Phycisphaerae bacterium]|nr:diaminopimelate decarboxylase [Phycisphaerae bacterium]